MAVTNYLSVDGQIFGQYTDGGGAEDFIRDALGNIIAVYNNSTIRADASYTAFGRPNSASWQITNYEFQWAGTWGYKALDLDWVSHYVRSRHYSQADGTWISVDPLWPHELAYQYVGQKAMSAVDPSGADIIWCFGGCIIGVWNRPGYTIPNPKPKANPYRPYRPPVARPRTPSFRGGLLPEERKADAPLAFAKFMACAGCCALQSSMGWFAGLLQSKMPSCADSTIKLPGKLKGVKDLAQGQLENEGIPDLVAEAFVEELWEEMGSGPYSHKKEQIMADLNKNAKRALKASGHGLSALNGLIKAFGKCGIAFCFAECALSAYYDYLAKTAKPSPWQFCGYEDTHDSCIACCDATAQLHKIKCRLGCDDMHM